MARREGDILEASARLAFESEFIHFDTERTADILRSCLCSIDSPSPNFLSQFWLIYGHFCLRAGDRLKTAEIAFIDSLTAEPSVGATAALIGVLIAQNREVEATRILKQARADLTHPILELIHAAITRDVSRLHALLGVPLPSMALHADVNDDSSSESPPSLPPAPLSPAPPSLLSSLILHHGCLDIYSKFIKPSLAFPLLDGFLVKRQWRSAVGLAIGEQILSQYHLASQVKSDTQLTSSDQPSSPSRLSRPSRLSISTSTTPRSRSSVSAASRLAAITPGLITGLKGNARWIDLVVIGEWLYRAGEFAASKEAFSSSLDREATKDGGQTIPGDSDETTDKVPFTTILAHYFPIPPSLPEIRLSQPPPYLSSYVKTQAVFACMQQGGIPIDILQSAGMATASDPSRPEGWAVASIALLRLGAMRAAGEAFRQCMKVFDAWQWKKRTLEDAELVRVILQLGLEWGSQWARDEEHVGDGQGMETTSRKLHACTLKLALILNDSHPKVRWLTAEALLISGERERALAEFLGALEGKDESREKIVDRAIEVAGSDEAWLRTIKAAASKPGDRVITN